MSPQHQNIFVYGTLKRGQCRETCWPTAPLRIAKAWTLGQLHDLGPHPAMLPGDQRVAGEVWMFPHEQASSVLRVLDDIEGTNQPGQSNEYDRLQIEVHLLDGDSIRADSYFYAKREQLFISSQHIEPSRMVDGNLYAIWPPTCSW